MWCVVLMNMAAVCCVNGSGSGSAKCESRSARAEACAAVSCGEEKYKSDGGIERRVAGWEKRVRGQKAEILSRGCHRPLLLAAKGPYRALAIGIHSLSSASEPPGVAEAARGEYRAVACSVITLSLGLEFYPQAPIWPGNFVLP